ncbi:uncharacterized protein LOC122075649 [Macadamia integrifolia]|uniref:uncharacterized protein LOC122075649 n=1 Tax=Macadamia integrifolia TaxID=60698 RepID=UPI001C4E817D|nr:uncharacterized protein LOC122075649 [Macadamia integrifolia]
MAWHSNGFMVMAMMFFFASATIIPAMLASRGIAPAPSESDDDIDRPIAGFDNSTKLLEDDSKEPEENADFSPSPAPAWAPQPEAVQLPPEPQPGFYSHLKSCVEVIPVECGQPIVDSIYKDTRLDGYCCQKLVEMGKDCHLALVKVVELVDKSHEKVISQRGLQVWNQCDSLVVKNVSPSPSP